MEARPIFIHAQSSGSFNYFPTEICMDLTTCYHLQCISQVPAHREGPSKEERWCKISPNPNWAYVATLPSQRAPIPCLPPSALGRLTRFFSPSRRSTRDLMGEAPMFRCWEMAGSKRALAGFLECSYVNIDVQLLHNIGGTSPLRVLLLSFLKLSWNKLYVSVIASSGAESARGFTWHIASLSKRTSLPSCAGRWLRRCSIYGR